MKSQDMNIAFIIDESYVMPLAVACRSLTIHTHRPFNIFILDMGLSSQSKAILRGVLAGASLSFIKCLVSSPFVAKLMLASHLPTLSKILYLDADILIRSDMGHLWDLVSDTKWIAAATDIGEASLSRPYFNAGAIFLNLEAMRGEKIEEQMLDWVRKHARGIVDLSVFRWKDQDVLNHVYNGRWKEFPLSWNAQGIDYYAPFRINNGLITATSLRHLQSNADIVHFTGATTMSLDQFNSYCPMPTKPWSGHVCSQTDSRKRLSYVQEWYTVLHSIPPYKSLCGEKPELVPRNGTRLFSSLGL